ncbi:MAG: hypothetical protein AAF975_07565 [Spirochaetota bacterium]
MKEGTVYSKVLLLLLILFLGACTSKENMLNHQDFLERYQLLEDPEHILLGKTSEQILRAAQNGESFILLLGFDTCPWCQVLVPVLNAEAKERHIAEIWYWDPKNFRGDGRKVKHAKEYLQMLDLIGLERPTNNADKGVAGISRISVPFVAAINYGEVGTFEEVPIQPGEGRVMRDSEGEAIEGGDDTIRYQDGFMLTPNGEVLAAYMWDDLLTGYQTPPEYKSRLEWLNREEFVAPLRNSLRTLLNISACGLCSP